MSKELPPLNVLRQLLDYDPETGILTWKPRPPDMFKNSDKRICATWNSRYAGKEALSHVDTFHGYKVGAIKGRNYLAHRVAWKMHSGVDPNFEIDHINGNRADNRIENLRDVSKAENQRNAGVRSDNKSGVTGVHWHKVAGKWAATVQNRSLGVFDRIEDAIMARQKAVNEIGFHKNHGKRKGRPKPPQSKKSLDIRDLD